MSDVNDPNDLGSSTFDQQYDVFMRDVAMLESRNDDQSDSLDDFEFKQGSSNFDQQHDEQSDQHGNSESQVLHQSGDVGVEQSPLSSFLTANAGVSHYKNEVKKSDLTKLLKEYTAIEVKNGNEQNAPLTKTNGHFYLKEELNIGDALKEIGFSDAQVQDNQSKFHFEPIGRIGSANGGFDAFVMVINDNIPADEAKALKIATDNQKAATVQSFIDSHPTPDEIVENLVKNAQNYANNDQSKRNNKRPPFIAVGDAYFLNAKGLKSHLDNIDGVKGNYRLINILPKEDAEHFNYPQKSNDLNSHYPVQLGLYKVVTKDSDTLSQVDLEQKITDNLKHFKAPIVNNSPVANDADILEHDTDHTSKSVINPSQIIDPTKKSEPTQNKSVDQIYEGEKVAPQPKPSAENKQTKNNSANKKPNSTQEFVNSLDETSEKPRKHTHEPDLHEQNKQRKVIQQKSIAEIAVEAVSKVSQAAIAAMLAIVKMMLKLLLETLKMLFSGVSRLGNRITPKIPIYDYGMAKGFNNMSNHIVGTIPTFKNTMDALKYKNDKSPNANPVAAKLDADGEKLSRKEKAAKKLADALDAGFSASPISESEILKPKDPNNSNTFDPLSKLTSIDLTSTNDMTSDTLKTLEADVTAKINGFDEQMKKDFINSIPLNTLHSTSPDLIDKLNEQTIYNEKFGILLGEGDRVQASTLNGDYAVLAAYEKDSVLKYALAKEDANGEYSVEIRDAKDLQLMQHNAFAFDNKDSLIQAVDQKFLNDEFGNLNGFEKVEILNAQNPQPYSLNIAEVIGKNHPVKLEDVLEANREAIMGSISLDDTPVVPSIHKQGIAEPRDFRMSHPTLHRLLDINDTVEAEINGNKLSGVVVGAHLNKGELNYQIKKDDHFFKVPAKELSLIGLNNGGLTSVQIASLHAQNFKDCDEAFKKELTANKKLDRVPLSSKLLDDVFILNDKTKQILFSGNNNSEIKSLERGRVVYKPQFDFHDLKPLPILAEKMNYQTNKREYFIAIGGIGEREDAKALMIQVDKNLLGGLSITPGAKAKIEDLNANEIKRIIPFNGKAQRLSNQLLADYTIAFKNGQDRQLQNAVDAKLDASPEIATNLKHEYYASNMAAAYLLKDHAAQIVKAPLVLGANANLNNASINTVEPKQPDTTAFFVKESPTFDTNPTAVINPSNATPTDNTRPVFSFVNNGINPSPFAQAQPTPQAAAQPEPTTVQPVYTFNPQEPAVNPYKSVQAPNVQPSSVEPVVIIPTDVPAVTAVFDAANKPEILNFRSNLIHGLQEKAAPLIAKFEDGSSSPYQDGLQLKAMLKGVYADDEFKRIQQHEHDSTQSLTYAAKRLAEIVGVPVENENAPYEILNEVMNVPDAQIKIKSHLDANPQDKAEIHQNLKDSINSADLYQSNLANYSNDIAEGIKEFTNQQLNDDNVRNDYIGMIKDADNIFEMVNEDTLIKGKMLNDFTHISKGLTNGDTPESLIKELSSTVRNVDRDYTVNMSSLTSTIKMARESIASSANEIEPNRNSASKQNSLDMNNG